MDDILQELMTLAGVPLEEAETPTPQFPNLNLNREKIIPDDDPVKIEEFSELVWKFDSRLEWATNGVLPWNTVTETGQQTSGF